MSAGTGWPWACTVPCKTPASDGATAAVAPAPPEPAGGGASAAISSGSNARMNGIRQIMIARRRAASRSDFRTSRLAMKPVSEVLRRPGFFERQGSGSSEYLRHRRHGYETVLSQQRTQISHLLVH